MTKNERLKEVVGALKFYSKLRQKEVAKSVGTSPTYLSDMMNGGVEVSDSFVERLCASFPVVNKDYVLVGSGFPLFRVEGVSYEPNVTEQSSGLSAGEKTNFTSDSGSVSKPSSTEDSVTLPSSAWKVIELQAASLAEKDRQASLCLEMMEEKDRNTSRCIAMLEQSFDLIKKGFARVADAASADAGTSAVG